MQIETLSIPINRPGWVAAMMIFITLTGCGEAKRAADFALAQMTASKAQQDAENACLQEAFKAESKKNKGAGTPDERCARNLGSR
jgi:hypothetical protein